MSQTSILLITLALSVLIMVVVFDEKDEDLEDRKDLEDEKYLEAQKIQKNKEDYCVDISGGYKGPCRESPLGMCVVKEINEC